ncbi:hypothetical protein CKA32_000669 [Geitlerinema sp. FC II]|nr:hypothetical protein CKA32_000669 [Geitlerinema sp. FC II]
MRHDLESLQFQSLEGIFGFFNRFATSIALYASAFQSLEGIFGFFNTDEPTTL